MQNKHTLWYVLLFISLFVGGSLFGVWIDYSKWLHISPERAKLTTLVAGPVVYHTHQVGTASLVLSDGASVTLTQEDGSTPGKMNFLGGYAPCAEGNLTDICTIPAQASSNRKPDGVYYYSCDDDYSKTYWCPDPAIEQKPGTGPTTFPKTFLEALYGDLLHLKEIEKHAEKKVTDSNPSVDNRSSTAAPAAASNSEKPGAKPLTTLHNSVGAYVICNQNATPIATAVYPLNQIDPVANANISASPGQMIVWESPVLFTLSGIPANSCSEGAPDPHKSYTKAICTLTKGSTTFKYTANSSQCNTTSPSVEIDVN